MRQFQQSTSLKRVQNKLHFAVTGKTAAELIYERADAAQPTMGLTTWNAAPDGKILKRDVTVAKNYLNEKELSRLNRLVTMFIDYAELMAEDEVLMSMKDWLDQTNVFLTNNRRKVLEGKGIAMADTVTWNASEAPTQDISDMSEQQIQAMILRLQASLNEKKQLKELIKDNVPNDLPF